MSKYGNLGMQGKNEWEFLQNFFFQIHEFSVFKIVDIINEAHLYQISPYQKQNVHYRRVNTILTQLFISAVILIPRCKELICQSIN